MPPTFQAINVEAEENVEDEADTLKELQIDDALKLFQTALKLHAQGPDTFDDAEKAYEELFESEIFKYPEAATEYDRAQRQPEHHPVDTPPSASTVEPEYTVSAADADGLGTSLPQALYLAHKNRGQLVLDRLRHEAREHEGSADEFFRRSDVVNRAQYALAEFNAALDRDPSDAELWRRAARVASFLKSTRTTRYCLEAAVELDDDPAVLDVPPPSLVEGLAGEQLKNQLSVLSDSMGLSHPVMAPWNERQVPKLMKRFLDPIPFLPDPAQDLGGTRVDYDKLGREKTVIQVKGPSWKDVGLALLRFVESHGICADALTLEVPDLPDLPDDDIRTVTSHSMNGDHDDEGHHDSPSAQLRAEVATPEEISGASASDDGKVDEPAVAEPQKASEGDRKESNMSLPHRKRSQSAAGVTEGAEEEAGVEKRSKRTRRRETLAEEAADASALYASKIAEYQAADKNLFQMTKDILENLGVSDTPTLHALTEMLESCDSEDRLSKLTSLASNDLRAALTSIDEPVAKILSGTKERPSLSLSSFLEHAKGDSQKKSGTPAFDQARGLKAFVDSVNAGWYTIHDVVPEWMRRICSSYLTSDWSDDMKEVVVQVINKLDTELYERIVEQLSGMDEADGGADSTRADFENMVQMLFELLLDVYELITNPNSVVQNSVRLETRSRLERWQDLASAVFRRSTRSATDPVCLRFIWASIFSTSVLENQVRRDHILQCYESFRNLMAADDCQPIHLPNNAVIPVISIAAVDREISKLTTMDFFLGLFHDEMDDPVSVIESLEPVLNPSSVFVRPDGDALGDRSPADLANGHDKVPVSECASQRLHDLWNFLKSSNTELRLFLWSRLGEAYGAINYTTKQFSCRLRSIEMVVADLTGDPYLKTPSESRGALFMRLLKSLDELLIQALTLALNEVTSFEIIDEDHLRSSTAAIARVNCLLHTAAICEDEMRIASTLPSPTSTSALQQLLNKLREMQTRAWSLQYTLVRSGIRHNKDIFANPDNDLAEFLAAVHHVLGIRKFCKASNKTFLKMMRVELLKLPTVENWEDYLGQVLYDLHGLKLGVGMWEVEDHECPPEKLEKRTTIHLVERITMLASRMPLKELLKSDLKATIERMQQTMGQTKTTPQTIHNLRNFTEFLKRPIHPLRLIEARKGHVTVDAISINNTESTIAKHGWFFLLGMIALTRFKGVDLNRRQTPGATDDLRLAATFMRMQLQYTPGRWDAWFRLAECFDYELDEAVLWTADKMNKDRVELVKLQRSAIHCYTLALSNSRSADPEGDEAGTLHELYYKFGMRLYASSREPFAMEAFQNSDQKRFNLSYLASWTQLPRAYPELKAYQVWKYAAWLFRKASAIRPKDWKNKYMFSKCLWKMYQKDDGGSPTLPQLFTALHDAAATAAAMPKSRHSDPVLEPHYKVLSVVHKLVMNVAIDGERAGEILAEQPFGLVFDKEDKTELNDNATWVAYALRNLRHLRDKDKSNWQHRLIMRHSRILFYDDGRLYSELDQDALKKRAGSAFNVLRESMFTKTMVMNVWKCDSERPGRHHVYTEQYVRFAVKLLVILENRVDLEALLRRIRKKGADFYHFSDLWQSCCTSYVDLLRQTYNIPPGLDEPLRKLNPEDFERNTERVVEYAGQPPDRHATLPPPVDALRCLKDVIELKKLNSNLMKATAIDDLICDCYAILYRASPAGDELDGIINGAPSAARTPEPMALDEETKKKTADEAGDRNGEGLNGLLQPPGAEGVTSGAPTEAEAERETEAPSAPAARSRRAVVVRRPDILRKAEYLVQRLAEAKTEGSGSKSRAVSVSSGKNVAASGDVSDVEMEDQSKDETGVEGEAGEGDETKVDDEGGAVEDEGKEDGAQEGVASPVGSVHEVDETDMSDAPRDLDEDKMDEEPGGEEGADGVAGRKPLFPNLRRSSEGSKSREREGEGDGQDEGDGDDEGDGSGEK